MTSQTFALRARWIVPVCGPPIAGGIVVVHQGRIVAVGSDAQDAPLEDLGDVALLPGLVNAHTHLEFSDLAEPLGAPGMPLPEWIGEVIAHRRGGSAGGVAAVAAGLVQSLASGTTTLGEIATFDWRAIDALPVALPGVQMFYELIGPTTPRAQVAAQAAEEFLKVSVAPEGVMPGLSPHAPYTVHPRLLAALVELSQRYRVPLAMHLAESREELELLNLGSGPFREMLEAVGAWEPGDEARLSCTLDYLAELARAERALVVHGNYLDEDEIAFLADHAARMAVVYCPRTHRYFEHEPYPLAALMEAGVTVGLGTDSRASNPNLSLLEEIKSAAQAHPDVPPATILELATLGGARALGLANRVGTLEAGKSADLVAIEIACASSDPIEGLLDEGAKGTGTWIGGLRACRGKILD